MLPVLYGKQRWQETLSRMVSGGRLAQGFLFYGDAGLGRKTLAHWFAALLLCEQPQNGQPCSHCKACRTMAKDCHPDFIEVEHSGKLGGFSVETVRQICSSVSIPPNNGGRKVYLFADCDPMDVRSQNLLLKILEEPPSYAYFLFTASAKDTLLGTIRSRILSFGLLPCETADCQQALADMGLPDADCQRFPGNIGQCLTYAQDAAMQTAVQRAVACVQAMQQRDEYTFLQLVAQIGKDRKQAEQLLHLLKDIIRDGMVLHCAPEQPCCSCAPELAAALARQISLRRGQQQYAAIRTAEQALHANVNVQLLLAALCAEWMNA